MFRTFSFLNPSNPEFLQKNWRTLDEGTKSVVFTPTIASTTNTVTASTSVAQIYGPMTQLMVTISVPVLAGFSTSTTVKLPMEAFHNSGTLTIPTVLNVTLKDSGAVVDTCYFSDKTTLKFASGYINNSSTTQTVNIQGWYFRN